MLQAQQNNYILETGMLTKQNSLKTIGFIQASKLFNAFKPITLFNIKVFVFLPMVIQLLLSLHLLPDFKTQGPNTSFCWSSCSVKGLVSLWRLWKFIKYFSKASIFNWKLGNWSCSLQQS
jgi:hypothetical protein